MSRRKTRRVDQEASIECMDLLRKEFAKTFYCVCCSLGFDDLEEYREHHNDDEEHKYHVLRRVKMMVPGLGYCAACSQLMHTPYQWKSHSKNDKHNKCITSLRAIGIPGDYSRPLGCTVRGRLGGAVDPARIDSTEANSNGYMAPSNIAGVPIIGLNFVSKVSFDETGKKYCQYYKCDVCDSTFHFKDRKTHLASMLHRKLYLKKHYSEWSAEVQKIPEVLNQKVKRRLCFYAHKVVELEKEYETSDAKELRKELFNMPDYLRFKNKSKLKGKRGKNRVDPYSRLGSLTIEVVNNERPRNRRRSGVYEPGPSRIEPPFPSDTLPIRGKRSVPSRREAPLPRSDRYNDSNRHLPIHAQRSDPSRSDAPIPGSDRYDESNRHLPPHRQRSETSRFDAPIIGSDRYDASGRRLSVLSRISDNSRSDAPLLRSDRYNDDSNRHLPVHRQRPDSSLLEAPLPLSDGRVVGLYDDDRFDDHREPLPLEVYDDIEPSPPPTELKKENETYTEQYEMDEAVEAINILEKFNLKQSEKEIKEKMKKMRDAVLSGSRLSDIQGYGDVISTVKERPGSSSQSVDRASPPPPHFPKTPLLDVIVDQPQSHKMRKYSASHPDRPTPTSENVHVERYRKTPLLDDVLDQSLSHRQPHHRRSHSSGTGRPPPQHFPKPIVLQEDLPDHQECHTQPEYSHRGSHHDRQSHVSEYTHQGYHAGRTGHYRR